MTKVEARNNEEQVCGSYIDLEAEPMAPVILQCQLPRKHEGNCQHEGTDDGVPSKKYLISWSKGD